jgi:hypothetical protein
MEDWFEISNQQQLSLKQNQVKIAEHHALTQLCHGSLRLKDA